MESLFRSPLVCNEFYALYFLSSVVFIALRPSLYGGLGNLNIMMCFLVPIILTYFLLLFWGLYFYTLSLYSLLSHLWATENPYTGNFLTPTTTNTHSPWQLGLLLHLLWSDGLGQLVLISYILKVPEGAVLCLLTYAEAHVSLSGLLLTCTGSTAEMWEPVPQSGLC